MEDVDGCFHLAAISSVQTAADSWTEASTVNVVGTINVFDVAANSADRAIPVVYASSCAVYGNHRDTAHTESVLPQPINSYGIDKYCSELYARFVATAKGMRSHGLRLFIVYGPRQDPSSPYSGVISIFVDRLLQGKELAIHRDGKQTRDFVHVEDVVSFFMCALERADRNSQVVNVCRGAKIQIYELAHTLADILGQRHTYKNLQK
ncbi:MAG: NAD-dependent epimerase/dehydratase family protein, partial [Planctomycetes bacterium]|nr:NAD-dependent epimerase/dehydratase family protein [Planctomycetota bacterium]